MNPLKLSFQCRKPCVKIPPVQKVMPVLVKPRKFGQYELQPTISPPPRLVLKRFTTLRKYQMKLNPEKCAFGVGSGKFLGFMVSQQGIEANPEKIKALIKMQSPRTVKKVQRLTGRVAALNRFISRATDKCLPLFKVLRQAFE